MINKTPRNLQEINRKALERHAFIVIYEFLYAYDACDRSSKNFLSKKIATIDDKKLYELINLCKNKKLNEVMNIIEFKKGDEIILRNTNGEIGIEEE